MEKLDFKKADKELYQPKTVPGVVNVPEMTFIQVDGQGDPNEPEGEYQRALETLYSLSYAIKMAPKSSSAPEGYFEYVVPPLEGLWWQEGIHGVDYTRKDRFCWTAMIRQPEFVNEQVYAAAVETVTRKKPQIDISAARLVTFAEGLCVQCMHIGSYDDEPATVDKMNKYIAEQGLLCDLSDIRKHHEIYLSDPRKSDIAKLKTIVRHPVRKAD
ncbi:transcriptional regulator [Paenibacillus sp. FSL R7-0273]|uniref:GyrI-like domain-containing protein n=1 Tax=Paenibacillus sp. FSL R7-0273 TaxID=1536772 RepID=UPI0004F7B166|nr:GyrI-like domain-containing protein [Paenibacillus sp. FSL R7-0273]AIQ48699.1 transcriptional regulator [Paenibacillus sp. FSL R7-0273]OMF93953.1 transcriptional regulator [Paenibacillus sp. FSL R7-0273]